jgi:hypothetical protein
LIRDACADARQYEVELERCLELRRSSLSSFVVASRKEIELLWGELMLGDDEKGEFGPYIDGKSLKAPSASMIPSTDR